VKAPTFAQTKVLRFMHELACERGYPATVRELCAYFGWSSTNAAASHLGFLEAKGLITRALGAKSRTTVLTEEGKAWVAAHQPTAAERRRYPAPSGDPYAAGALRSANFKIEFER
jgi:SOS-response transcriptional repressor LexA